MINVYSIFPAPVAPRLDQPADFASADVAHIRWFHPKSTDHHPPTQVRVLHDDQFLYFDFRVKDRYVRAIHLERQVGIWKDSCVECFFQPVQGGGYFNLEINAAGIPLMYFIEDPRRTPNGFEKFQPIANEWLDKVDLFHSLTPIPESEIQEPVSWRVAARVPLALVQHYQPLAQMKTGISWRGNFHKCGDETSHPHYGTWSPIGEILEFHQPARFGQFDFAPMP